MGNCCFKEESNFQTLFPFANATDKKGDYNRKEYIEYRSKSLNYLKTNKTKSPLKNPFPLETTEKEEAEVKISNKEQVEKNDIADNIQIVEMLEDSDKLSNKNKDKLEDIVIESKYSKFLSHLKLKLNNNKRISTDFILNKESLIKESSNYLSDNYSLLQEKENFFPEDQNIKKEQEQSNTILNNFDITNLLLENSSIMKKSKSHYNSIDIGGFHNANLGLKDSLSKSQFIEINDQDNHDYLKEIIIKCEDEDQKQNSEQLIEVVETSFKSMENTSKNGTSIIRKEQYKKKVRANKQLKNSTSTIISNHSKYSNSTNNRKTAKKITLIPLSRNLETNKNTISSENTNLSSHRKENNDISKNVAKLKQFELLLKSNSLLRTNSNSSKRNKKNNSKFSVNNTIISTMSNKNRISMNKYGYLFSDVNPKPNNNPKMSCNEPISYLNTNETQVTANGLKGTLLGKYQDLRHTLLN